MKFNIVASLAMLYSFCPSLAIFNYEVGYRIRDNIALLLKKVSEAGNIPYITAATNIVNIR